MGKKFAARAAMGAALLASSLFMPDMARAAKGDFPLCDGFPAPKKNVDNMLKETVFLGLVANTAGGRKSATGIGEQGVRACEASLADPLLLPAFWQRRAHLLVSKALHLIATEKYDAALTALDDADKIAASNEDAIFEDSAMLGGKMLRAVALGRSGKKDEARQILSDLRQIRPYASTILRSIERLESSLDPDIGKMIASSKKLMAIEPYNIRAAFQLHLFKGEIEQAAEYEDDLSLTPPKAIGGWTVTGDETKGYTDEYEAAELDATRAYVMAGTGQPDKAAVLHGNIRATIAELRIPPPPPEKGQKPRKSVLRDFEARTQAATRIENMLESWQKAAEIRKNIIATPTSIETVKDDFTKYRIHRTAAQYDLLRLLKPTLPAEKEALAKILEAMDRGIADEVFNLSGAELFKMLPRPESLKLVPKFTRAGDGILLAREIGASQAKEKNGPARTIRFGSATGSPALVEELGMLAVADYAKKEAADSFIILSRRTITRTLYSYGMYGSGATPAGYESQLRVILLNSKALPADLESKRWRLINAEDITNKLQPKFDAIEAQKLALRK
jgi:tetratricopeptide (TPR) repeat protein